VGEYLLRPLKNEHHIHCISLHQKLEEQRTISDGGITYQAEAVVSV